MRASLRAAYRIDLRQPGVSGPDLAELAMWLPPGSALWMSVGGPMAWSPEFRALNAVEFRLRVLDWRKSNGRQPTPPEEPPYAHERAAKEATIRRQADAYLRRQARKRE